MGEPVLPITHGGSGHYTRAAHGVGTNGTSPNILRGGGVWAGLLAHTAIRGKVREECTPPALAPTCSRRWPSWARAAAWRPARPSKQASSCVLAASWHIDARLARIDAACLMYRPGNSKLYIFMDVFCPSRPFDPHLLTWSSFSHNMCIGRPFDPIFSPGRPESPKNVIPQKCSHLVVRKM